MKEFVYIVRGNQGEYDDYREWDVCAFKDKSTANKEAKVLNQWLKDNKIHTDFECSENNNLCGTVPKGCPDKQLTYLEYTGAEYCVVKLELK